PSAAKAAAEAPGPKPVDDRLCLQGILYVLYKRHQMAIAAAGAGVRLRTNLLVADWAGGMKSVSSTSCTVSCSPS
ncbi:hypothetical protein ABZ703_37420, partial [Streptomyces massasporeus]|uniref:hypothetical protein n=1 Tax=Streptomyces massasporeus TaxID=67324 RepID=UPI0033DE796A